MGRTGKETYRVLAALAATYDTAANRSIVPHHGKDKLGLHCQYVKGTSDATVTIQIEVANATNRGQSPAAAADEWKVLTKFGENAAPATTGVDAVFFRSFLYTHSGSGTDNFSIILDNVIGEFVRVSALTDDASATAPQLEILGGHYETSSK